MSIVDYTTLQASVASWLHRSDLSAVIPDFITLAEAKLNGDVESRSMEARVTLTCVPVANSLTARIVALPTDMLEMKRLAIVDADPASVLEYKSPDQLMQDNPYVFTAGKPVAFTIIGANLELAPPPDSAYPLELIYEQRIPALSVTNPTNWLLAAQPNAYLFGALIESVAYTLDEARLPAWQQKYQEAVEAVNSIDWYSGSTMRVKTR